MKVVVDLETVEDITGQALMDAYYNDSNLSKKDQIMKKRFGN